MGRPVEEWEALERSARRARRASCVLLLALVGAGYAARNANTEARVFEGRYRMQQARAYRLHQAELSGLAEIRRLHGQIAKLQAMKLSPLAAELEELKGELAIAKSKRIVNFTVNCEHSVGRRSACATRYAREIAEQLDAEMGGVRGANVNIKNGVVRCDHDTNFPSKRSP